MNKNNLTLTYVSRKRFIGERVALFSKVVKLCLELNIRMIIDIKSDSNKVSFN